MEGSSSIRSGGGVLKKKSSSGCLIIKKKGEIKYPNSGQNVNFHDKKRGRVVDTDSSESDDDDSEEEDEEDESLEFMRRKVNDKRLHNNGSGSMGYSRNNVGVEIGGGERKRSRSDLFEFDEYDEFGNNDEYVEDRFKMVARSGGGGSSERNLMVDRRKQNMYYDGSSSGRGKGIEHGGLRNKREDEGHMSNSMLRMKYQDSDNEPIRLQGKNGVLKVMVNKKKKLDMPSQHNKYDHREVDERQHVMKKDLSARFPVIPASRIRPENRGLFIDEEKPVQKEERGVKLERMRSDISRKSRELESDGTDTALKLGPPGPSVSSSKKMVTKEDSKKMVTKEDSKKMVTKEDSKKMVMKEEKKILPPEKVTPVKSKEGNEVKAKRGGSTEKQMLREKIRAMLIDAGWTIDYRPRRNRDYLDSVYISPSGTAYWSIIKAYDAFKKDPKSNSDVGSPSFAPLPEDLINKLTRQTKKKIEQEMRRKRKEDNLIKSTKKSREVDEKSEDDLSDDSPKRKLRKIKVETPFSASNSNILQGRTSKIIGRCTLLVRGKGENSESDGYVPYSGKRTVLAWLIDSGTAQLSEKVQYMNRRRTRAMLEGWITRDGVHCVCCSKILTVSKFELHAGSKLRQPFQNIFLESGASLLQCQVDAWNKQKESVRSDFHAVKVDGDDPDDDTCGICGDGGALICCDSCPSTFHQTCLGIQILPSGDWHCPNCICKFCGDATGDVANENGTTTNEFAKCSFCEKKYHKSCSEGVHALPMSSNGTSFCELKCQELYDHLQKILGVKHELEGGFSWSLLQRTDISDTSHRAYPLRVECNSKLAVSLSVMDECFLPINDRRSGFNMIHNVVYNCGSNFNRLNYRGFYTAVLERGDEIVSAASIRIHGTRLAEMPFIGTRDIYRRQGMCRRLLSAIETELRSLKVEQLVIPAIAEHMNTWTTVFGFHQLDDVLKKQIKSMNMLVFPGTDMLQKPLTKQEISDAVGMKVPESIKDDPQLPSVLEKSDIDSSMGTNKPAVPSNDSKADSASDSASESDTPLASNETTVIESEVENKQNELSAKTSIISDVENEFVDLPVKDKTNLFVESALGKACLNDANDEENIASSPKKDVNEEPLDRSKQNSNQPTKENVEEIEASPIETINYNKIPAPVPNSGESSVTGGSEVKKPSGEREIVNEEPLDRLQPNSNQLTKENVKETEVSPIETINDKIPVPVPNSGESTVTGGSHYDKSGGEREIVNEEPLDRLKPNSNQPTKENVEETGVIAIEKINEDIISAPVPNSQESIVTGGGSDNDKLGEESEIVNEEPLDQLKPNPNQPTKENVEEIENIAIEKVNKDKIPALVPNSRESTVTGGGFDDKLGGEGEIVNEEPLDRFKPTSNQPTQENVEENEEVIGIETINETQIPAPVPNSGESIVTGGSDDDKPGGESENVNEEPLDRLKPNSNQPTKETVEEIEVIAIETINENKIPPPVPNSQECTATGGGSDNDKLGGESEFFNQEPLDRLKPNSNQPTKANVGEIEVIATETILENQIPAPVPNSRESTGTGGGSDADKLGRESEIFNEEPLDRLKVTSNQPTKENVEEIEVDAIETINENKFPAPVPDSGESIVTGGSDDDKPGVESENVNEEPLDQLKPNSNQPTKETVEKIEVIAMETINENKIPALVPTSRECTVTGGESDEDKPGRESETVNEEKPLDRLKPNSNQPTKENVEELEASPIETDVNKISAPVSGESTVTGGSDDDKPGEESEKVLEVGLKVEKVASPVLSTEVLAENSKNTKDHTE